MNKIENSSRKHYVHFPPSLCSEIRLLLPLFIAFRRSPLFSDTTTLFTFDERVCFVFLFRLFISTISSFFLHYYWLIQGLRGRRTSRSSFLVLWQISSFTPIRMYVSEYRVMYRWRTLPFDLLERFSLSFFRRQDLSGGGRKRLFSPRSKNEPISLADKCPPPDSSSRRPHK